MKKRLFNTLLSGVLALGVVATGFAFPCSVKADEIDDEFAQYCDFYYSSDDDDDDDDFDYPDYDNDGNNVDDYLYQDNPDHNTYQPTATLTGGIGDSVLTVGNSTCASVSVVSSNISDTSSLNIEWHSQDSSIASVSGSGSVVTIRANAPGVCGITATLYYQGQVMDAYFGQVTVTAAPVAAASSYVSVSGVSISNTSVSLSNPGDTTTISASVNPSNANNKGIHWCSNNSSVATVDGGYIRAISSGTAIITATSDEGGFPAYCTVTVGSSNNGVTPTSVSLNLKAVNLGVGQIMKLIPTVCPQNAGNKSVNWASTNPAVATVDGSGNIAAVGLGTCQIVCATVVGGLTATATVTVGSAASSINTGFVTVANVIDPNVNYEALTKIQKAKKNGTVTITTSMPKSFDKNVAAAMALRPDVKVVCNFPFNGHSFNLTIPKGYNLAATFNAAGYVEWLDLCKLNGIGGITVQMLN